MVNPPATLDTIVATNLHADILSDLAAALAGSLGIAPTGNIDPERRYRRCSSRSTGRLFDIMGKGANPGGYLLVLRNAARTPRRNTAAQRLMRAIEKVTAMPALHTRDLGGTATTAQVTDAVCRERGERRLSNAGAAPRTVPRRPSAVTVPSNGRNPPNKRRHRRRVITAACMSSLLCRIRQHCAGASLARQTDHADRAVPSGGTTDVLARSLAERWRGPSGSRSSSKAKPGAGATIGADFVAKAKPDGIRCWSARCITIATSVYKGCLTTFRKLRAGHHHRAGA